MKTEDLDTLVRQNVREAIKRNINPEPPQKEPQEED